MPERTRVMMDEALRGWRIGWLRAAAVPASLASAIRVLGAELVALPVLSLRAPPRNPTSTAARAEAIGAAVWIFVSPAAVRFAWKLWPDLEAPCGTRVFAVGPGTAAALSRRGIAAGFPPERHDSEGLLALESLREAHGPAAIFKAPGGRTLLADALRRRGQRVHELDVYVRVKARWDRRHCARLAELLVPPGRSLLIATSAEALQAFVRLAGEEAARATTLPIIVSSARLRGVAETLGFERVVVAAGTQVPALIRGIREVAGSPHGVSAGAPAE